MILGLAAGCPSLKAAAVVANQDNPGGSINEIAVAAAAAQTATTANYAFVPLNLPGSPLRITEDGTAIVVTYNGGNVYAYRWHQGVVTELAYTRPAGSRIKLHAANRNGMVVVVFEMPGGASFSFDGGSTKQVVVAWMPNSTIPVALNVPIARATTWYDRSVMRSVEFKFLDDQNRIWGNTYHEVDTGEGNRVYPELARWDTPDAPATFIGHKKFQTPSVALLGVISGLGEPFGYYYPPEAGSGSYPFAGSFSNRLSYVPAGMNRQGWVLGKRGFTPVLSREGIEYPLPANNSIGFIDDRNNLYDINRFTVWTTDPQTLLSTPTSPQSSYVALSTQSISLPDGYFALQRVAPGDTALVLNYLFTANYAVPAIFVPAEIRPDADRNGAISVSRMPGDPDRILAERNLPWYFWVNDDDDDGDTDGTDIPGGGHNGQDATVNGVRDLVDFFPLHLSIARLLDILPPTGAGISYKLAQADGAANFLTTGLSPETAGDYHRDSAFALTLGAAPVTQITNGGATLDQVFLEKISTEAKGVILVEARAPTTKPLRLEAWRGTELLARLDLPLRFDGVETMFRHRNLVTAVNMRADTPDRSSAPNWPDSLNNNQAFVFVHGYNVNQRQARGWLAEFFKRLWWSGSKAQFWGVTWYGSESQVPLAHFTPNYQINVVHAFGTAPKLAEFTRALRDPQGNPMTVNVAAHSLGNIVVSSAISDYQASVKRYFMIDAAVAAEAYDGEQGDGHVIQPDDGTAFLPHTQWNKELDGVYPPKLWPTNWHQLFKPPLADARYSLTWRDRFAPQTTTDYFDFHSAGEEVLGYDDEHAEDTPSLAGVLTTELATLLHITLPHHKSQPNGYQTWIYQEQLKGRTITGKILGSNYGGWGFNLLHFKKSPGGAGGKGPTMAPTMLRPNEITQTMLDQVFTEEVLREDPFFRPGGFWTSVGTWQYDRNTKKISWNSERLSKLYAPATGSAFASAHRDTLLARMIPAMSPAAGRIPVPRLKPVTSTEEHNFDMNGPDIRPRSGPNPPWPANRPTTNWRHSDLREVAYPYVRQLYQRIAEKAFLKEGTP